MHMFYTKVNVFFLNVFLALLGWGYRCNLDIYDILHYELCLVFIIVNCKCRWALRDDGGAGWAVCDSSSSW